MEGWKSLSQLSCCWDLTPEDPRACIPPDSAVGIPQGCCSKPLRRGIAPCRCPSPEKGQGMGSVPSSFPFQLPLSAARMTSLLPPSRPGEGQPGASCTSPLLGVVAELPPRVTHPRPMPNLPGFFPAVPMTLGVTERPCARFCPPSLALLSL